MFAFVVSDLVFSTKPRDWLGKTSPKLPMLCCDPTDPVSVCPPQVSLYM